MLLRTLTLGCKVNQYETQYVRDALRQAGYRDAAPGQKADLCIVNTCTVTLEGDYKCRKLIRQIARENPGAEVVVLGCYAARAPEQLAALPGVAEVVADRRRLPALLSRLGVTEPPQGISSFPSLHRALVKVQDGCRMQCSYCIVPKVRPILASRSGAEVLAEVRRLVAAGHLEIVLTGIHLGHYGVDLPPGPDGRPPDLAGLLREVLQIDGEFRVRLSSLEISEVTPELVELIASHPDRACPHLHVPLQSGSDALLRRMRRPWLADQFRRRCRELRQALDNPALTTDVIVGLPGETEGDFRATCELVEEIGFAKLHVFPYSPRPGTEAAEMPDQVPMDLRRARAGELLAIGRRLQQAYCRSLVGRPQQVLVESRVKQRPGMLSGTSSRYVTVELPDAPDRLHRLVWAVPEKVRSGRLAAPSLGHATASSPRKSG